jgi:hypothetical protein
MNLLIIKIYTVKGRCLIAASGTLLDSDDSAGIIATAWPLVVLVSVIIYPHLGIINCFENASALFRGCFRNRFDSE